MTLTRTLTLARSGALAAALLALGAAGGIAPAEAQRSRNQIVVAQPSDALSLDPSVDTSPISLNLFKNIYDQLTDITVDGSVAPQLATAWTASPDGKTWTFTIRTDAKFHDGTPVTPEDVIWSFQKILDDRTSPVRTYISRITAMEQVGANQVRFILSQPFAPWHRQVSLISIMPKAAYQRLGAEQFNLHPVGSGPYRVLTWVKDDRIELEANAGYWAGAPRIQRVIFRPVPNEATRTAALISGELDVVPTLPPVMVQRLQSVSRVRIQTVQSNRVLYLGFDVNRAPYSDIKLRQAIDHAIDRTAITERLLRGLGKPMGAVVAPVTFGYDPEIKPTSYDPALSRRLLGESSYRGQAILFQYPNNRYAFGEEVAQAVAGYLRAVGINVELQGMEYSAFFPLWLRRQLNAIHMFAFGPSIMDAELPLGSLYARDSRGYWRNDEIDSLIAAQRASADPAARQRAISRVWRMSQEFVPYSVLYNEIQAYGVARDLDWSPRPDERLLFEHASFRSN